MTRQDLPAAIFTAVLACTAASGVAAGDKYEANNAFFNATHLTTRTPPQLHDLEAVGGVADEDWFMLLGVREHRSYEALLNIDTGVLFVPVLERIDSDGSTLLQSSSLYVTALIGASSYNRHLR